MELHPGGRTIVREPVAAQWASGRVGFADTGDMDGSTAEIDTDEPLLG